MKSKNRIADALESIASELKDLNAICRKNNHLNELLLTNNEAFLKSNQMHYNIALASVLSELSIQLGEDAIICLDALQHGDLEKANMIIMAKKAPKKRGRKPKAVETEIKPEPKKRGRKPKQSQNQ